MMRQATYILLLIVASVLLYGCDSSTLTDSPGVGIIENPDWLVPVDQIYEGTGRDQISSIDEPAYLLANQIDFLEDRDLVIGLKIGTQIRAYPHRVLDYHEIVNDQFDDAAVAVTFCPLTGSAVAWNREIDGEITEFGVSGLIYKNNLVAYDRGSNSLWSQMLLQSINGERIGQKLKRFHLIEMNWERWKSLYPDSEVLTGEAGSNQSYSTPPYGNYPYDDDNILFPIQREDDRLNRKEVAHGMLYDQDLNVLPMQEIPDSPLVFNRNVAGRELVIIADGSGKFITAYSAVTSDGESLRFSTTGREPPALFEDGEGNIWDYFGEAIAGPRSGEKLQMIPSFNAYWFAWVDFYGLDPRRPHILTP